MKEEKLEELKTNIKKYIQELDEEIFPNKLKSSISIFLSGSTGWGIKEGFDLKADWDLHLILSDKDYKKYSEAYRDDYVIDDHKHVPNIFGQIRNKQWVKDRLSKIKQGDCLYIWIYNLGKQVGLLGKKAQECVALSETCLKSQTLEDIIENAKPLRVLVKSELKEKFGELPWIEEWWRYNKNPPEVKLVHSKDY